MADLRVSAPGSIMITGEHAAVYGHPAIVCAIEQRIFVELTALSEPVFQVDSEIAPPFEVPMDHLPKRGPMRFVAAAVAAYADHIEAGISLHIRSEIQPNLGLGSSAAVTMATLSGLNALYGAGHDLAALHAQGVGIVRAIQGRGSGADLAASLYGGVISYCILEDGPADVSPLPELPQLALCYTGYKTPTGDVLAQVAARMAGREAEAKALYAAMGQSARAAIDATKARDWPRLACELCEYQDHMRALGVSDARIEALIESASCAMAAKISGSGLGDCVLAVGECPEGFTPVRIAETGVCIDD